jgi:hypothetical protein
VWCVACACVRGKGESEPRAVPKISVRFHISGFWLGFTRSLEIVSIEPSLQIANATVAIVGKYLRRHEVFVYMGSANSSGNWGAHQS